MTDIDLLGPGAAGAARSVAAGSLPSGEISTPDASDTFFGDCVANTPGTGTPIVSTWLNRLSQQTRRVIRNAGVTLNNLDDDMLGKAIQSNAFNWAGALGGAVNAYTATLAPAPLALIPGTVVRAIVPTGGANTGASTLNVNGLGNIPITTVAGAAIGPGALVAGAEVEFVYTGAAFVYNNAVAANYLPSSAPFLGAFAAAQSISVTTETPLNFAGASPAWGTWATNTMTISVAGTYLVIANVFINATYSPAPPTTAAQLSIAHNANFVGTNEVIGYGATTYSFLLQESAVIDCAVGDTINAQVYMYSAGGDFSSAATSNSGTAAGQNNIAIVKLV